MLVYRVADPVNSRIISDSNVERIDHDHLVISVGSILVDPVRVQHTKVSTDTSSAFLSDTAKVADKLDLINTLILRLAIHSAFRIRTLSAASADCYTVHNVSLLGLVS
jgi:hypothetical protein